MHGSGGRISRNDWLIVAFVLFCGCSKEGLSEGDVPDGSTDSSASTAPDSGGDAPAASSYSCGPVDAGVVCSCGTGDFSPAPRNDAGQPQTVVGQPEPATVVAYHTMAEFDTLAVGRWERTAGQGELTCEQFGVEFTTDHRLYPLLVASDGSVQQGIAAHMTSFSISFDAAGAPTHLEYPGLLTNPPIFFDEGRSMYLLYAPWPAAYVRAP
jgi:hypothetical protein